MTLEKAVQNNPYNPSIGNLSAYIRYLRYNVDGFYKLKSKEVRKKYMYYICGRKQMIRAYDDYGNVVDLVEWEKQIRAEEREKQCDKIIDHYKPCNDCGACLEHDRDYFNKKCELNIQIYYTELVGYLEQLKEKDNDNTY